MKLAHTSIVTLITAIALSPGLLAEHQAADRTSAPGSAAESQLKTDLEGRILGLREYLGGSTAWLTGSSPRASERTGGAEAPSRSTQTPQPPQDRAGQQDKPGQKEPNPSGGASASAPSANWSSAPSAGDEPLVFVTHSRVPVTWNDGPNQRPGTAPSSPNPSSPAGSSTAASSTAYGGEVYVLLYNPSDVASRSAFAQAKAHRTSSSTATTRETPTSDRLRVKGTDESGTSVRQKLNEPDPNATQEIPRSGTARRDADSAYWRAGMAGKTVKISGRVLGRGGLQAIEITSLQDLGGSTTETDGSKDK